MLRYLFMKTTGLKLRDDGWSCCFGFITAAALTSGSFTRAEALESAMKFCILTGPLPPLVPLPIWKEPIAGLGFILMLRAFLARVELFPRPRSSWVIMRWLLLNRVKLVLTWRNGWLVLFRSGYGCYFDWDELPTATGRKPERMGLADGFMERTITGQRFLWSLS